MRTLLICHADAPLDREGLGRWLGSFSTFAGTVVIQEPRARLRRRVVREISRVGGWRMLDVLAYRLHHAIVHRRHDRRWESQELNRLRRRFPEWRESPECVTHSPNAPAAEAFIRQQQPDLVVARCKSLLKETIFDMPRLGTYAIHPGICPEYRNAHGCFWALANRDPGNVGATLLRIDKGVDTGPVYGYFRVSADPAGESHVVLQHRAVLEHLDGIRATLLDIESGRARPIDTAGRNSATWGQPWLSAYLKLRARERVGDSEGRQPLG
jgi:hypothetical protein